MLNNLKEVKKGKTTVKELTAYAKRKGYEFDIESDIYDMGCDADFELDITTKFSYCKEYHIVYGITNGKVSHIWRYSFG